VIFGQDRAELRRMYSDAWQKHEQGLPLSALEQQIADVVRLHPEYWPTITSGDVDADFPPEAGQSNPYLHMGLHLGLREQIATDRPAGIGAIWRQLSLRGDDPHDVEHRMIECLAETLWEAQSANAMPDEARYLERLNRL